jgi:hypothetical protein
VYRIALACVLALVACDRCRDSSPAPTPSASRVDAKPAAPRERRNWAAASVARQGAGRRARRLRLAPPNDPDVRDMKFLAANALFKWNQDDAIARLETFLREHRRGHARCRRAAIHPPSSPRTCCSIS